MVPVTIENSAAVILPHAALAVKEHRR